MHVYSTLYSVNNLTANYEIPVLTGSQRSSENYIVQIRGN